MKQIRLEKELKQIYNNPPLNWKVIKKNQSEWDCWITCDNSSPFYGSPFLLKILFPEDYPKSLATFKLPESQANTFYHPNIWNDGRICQKTLGDKNPLITVRDKVQAFITLLSTPNVDSPANSNAAAQFKQSQTSYYRTARLIFKGAIKKP